MAEKCMECGKAIFKTHQKVTVETPMFNKTEIYHGDCQLIRYAKEEGLLEAYIATYGKNPQPKGE